MILLDTDAIIALTRRAGHSQRLASREVFEGLVSAGHKLTTSRLNIAELQVGFHLSGNPEEEEKRVTALLENVAILDFDEKAALLFGRIESSLQRRGLQIGVMDTRIACIALVHSADIMTANVSHFSRFPDLRLHTF